MVEDKIDIVVVGQEPNPVRVGPGKVLGLAIDGEADTVGTGEVRGGGGGLGGGGGRDRGRRGRGRGLGGCGQSRPTGGSWIKRLRLKG